MPHPAPLPGSNTSVFETMTYALPLSLGYGAGSLFPSCFAWSSLSRCLHLCNPHGMEQELEDADNQFVVNMWIFPNTYTQILMVRKCTIFLKHRFSIKWATIFVTTEKLPLCLMNCETKMPEHEALEPDSKNTVTP